MAFFAHSSKKSHLWLSQSKNSTKFLMFPKSLFLSCFLTVRHLHTYNATLQTGLSEYYSCAYKSSNIHLNRNNFPTNCQRASKNSELFLYINSHDFFNAILIAWKIPTVECCKRSQNIIKATRKLSTSSLNFALKVSLEYFVCKKYVDFKQLQL